MPQGKIISEIASGTCYMVGNKDGNSAIDDDDDDNKKNVVNLIIPAIGKSYSLGTVETSNTLIAIPPIKINQGGNDNNDNIVKMKGSVLGRPTCSFLELKSYTIQKHHVYNFIKQNKKPIKLSLIAYTFQCSELEISNILDTIPRAYCDDANDNNNTWSIMEEDVENEIKLFIIECVIEHDWQDNDNVTIEVDKVVAIVKDKLESHQDEENINSSMIRHCILSMASSFPSKNAIETMSFDNNKIFIAVSRSILYKHKIMPISTFLKQLERELPHGIPISEEQHQLFKTLHAVVGITLSTDNYDDKIIEYYPYDTLSLDPKVRVKQLFSKKSKWLYNDIAPYLEQLCNGDNNASSVLAQHTKIEKGNEEDDDAYYIAK